MTKLTKKQKAAEGKVDATKFYAVDEAIGLVKSLATSKFDETVEVAMNLGVDPRHADQMVRGVVNLPKGTGKDVRVAVFAKGAKAEEATKAGADKVGAEDLMEEMQAGKLDYDRVIATPDMMGVVGRLGKVLGPKGLMPNPKLGTVTPNVGQAVKDAKGGQAERFEGQVRQADHRDEHDGPGPEDRHGGSRGGLSHLAHSQEITTGPAERSAGPFRLPRSRRADRSPA